MSTKPDWKSSHVYCERVYSPKGALTDFRFKELLSTDPEVRFVSSNLTRAGLSECEVTWLTTMDAIAVLVHKISYPCKPFRPPALCWRRLVLVDVLNHRWVECIRWNTIAHFRPRRHRRHSEARREDERTSDIGLCDMNLNKSQQSWQHTYCHVQNDVSVGDCWHLCPEQMHFM